MCLLVVVVPLSLARSGGLSGQTRCSPDSLRGTTRVAVAVAVADGAEPQCPATEGWNRLWVATGRNHSGSHGRRAALKTSISDRLRRSRSSNR
jgi:hypothetical protein